MVKASAYKRLLQRKINIIQKHKDKINEVGNYKLIEDVIQRAVAFRFKGSDYHVSPLHSYKRLSSYDVQYNTLEKISHDCNTELLSEVMES